MGFCFFDNDILNNPWLGENYHDRSGDGVKSGRFKLPDSTNWNNESFFYQFYLDLNTIDNFDGTDTNIFVQDVDKIKLALGNYNFIFIDKEKNNYLIITIII